MLKGLAILISAASAEAFAPAPLGSLTTVGRASCTSLQMASRDHITSRKNLLRGASSAALAAAVRVASAAAEEAVEGDVGQEGVTESGVKYKIIRATTAPGDKVGLVETAKKGDLVILTLKAKTADGNVIMDTSGSGQGFAIALGKGKTIQGLEDGVTGMKAGETRILSIPSGPLTDPIKQDVEVEVTYERKSNLMKFFGVGS